MMVDQELEQFKSAIDLRIYAAGQGYQLDLKESWRGSAVMRHPAGDKIIIKRNSNGHYVYFSVRDDSDNGTIVDFVQHRQQLSLGAVRKELRLWTGGSPVSVRWLPALPKTAKNRMRVEREYVKMREARSHPYLENERAIPASLLEVERFVGRVRMDERGNAVFPHFDREGLCGYEIKNTGFTGFSAGGTKGLWFSHVRADDNRLVFCESAIDALSQPFCSLIITLGMPRLVGSRTRCSPISSGQQLLECRQTAKLSLLWMRMQMAARWLV
jgi:hypothetical protein